MNPLRIPAHLRLTLLGLAALLGACASPPPARQEAPTTPSTQVFRYTGGLLTVKTQGTTCLLELKGEIQAATVRQMTAPLQAIEQAGCTHKTLALDATQGVLGDAITLGSMIRNRGYNTQVAPGATCNTPCMMVFAAGTERWLPAEPVPARIAFSQIPPDADFGRHVCETELSRGQQLTLLRYLRAMLPPPTALAVYQKLEAANCRSPDVYGPQEALAMGLATAVR
ncbi:hypothetical protein [Tepidicella baoligensis]|uniref:hypothetical protein n=1 Tax=Tepidicella baoligensis TaxID=2707016 RepID=UPI0015DB6B2B|nr:hypothetical protein [Tepidicella baoligensis]